MAGVLFMACIPSKEHEKELNPHLEGGKVKSETRHVRIEDEEDVELRHHEPEIQVPTDPDSLPKKGSWDRLKDLASPQKTDKEKKKKLDIMLDTSMEEMLTGILKNLKIDQYSWIPIQNEKFIHVIFSVEEGPPCEEALRVLTKWGVGVRCKSTLGIIPCAMYFKSDDSEESPDDDDSKSKRKDSGKSGWNEFVLSVVRSRLAVAQVVESVKGSAKLTFDFVCLIILAGSIAALGLIENSTVSIVASMLISPLMGPILAGTFGAVIHDRKLQLMGVRNELFGLSLTILVGYIIGLIIGSVDDYYGSEKWPTQEMMSRGLLRSLWVGALIALPSGAGVALGLLGDNSGSLIGVAISASLLPPAVNAGLLWALATLEGILNRDYSRGNDPKYAAKVYSDHLPSEYALLGCVSLSLTLVNIVCIFVAAILVLKIKEVAPRALTDDVQQFWHHDIKVARDYNRSLSREDARQFEKQLAEELAAVYSGEDGEANAALTSSDDQVAFRRRLSSLYHFSPDTLRRISVGPRRLSQTTWSPSPSTNLETHRRSSVRDLEKLYASLGGSEPPRLWKVAALRSVRGNKADDLSGLTPILEGNDVGDDAGRRLSYVPHRRGPRTYQNHRFTVIPSASDPLRADK